MTNLDAAIKMAMKHFIIETTYPGGTLDAYRAINKCANGELEENKLLIAFKDEHVAADIGDLRDLIENHVESNLIILKDRDNDIIAKINGLAPDLSFDNYSPYIADLPKLGVKETLALTEAIKEVFGTDFYKGKCVQIYMSLFIEIHLDSGFNATLPNVAEDYRAFGNDHDFLFSTLEEKMEEKLKFIDNVLLEAQTALVDAAYEDRLSMDFSELNLSELIEGDKA